MKVLLKPENNFSENFSVQDKLVLRNRIIRMILATDMADHISHLNYVDIRIRTKQITREQKNGHAFIDLENEKDKF